MVGEGSGDGKGRGVVGGEVVGLWRGKWWKGEGGEEWWEGQDSGGRREE